MKKKIKLTDKKNNSFVEVKCIRGRPRRIPTNHISLTTKRVNKKPLTVINKRR